jgi:hypothetical protein
MNPSDEEPERQLQELQDQSDELGDRVGEIREDWEAKKADASVPGAGGDPLAAQSDHADEQFPAVGDSGEFGEDHLPADESLDPQDPANEDL